MSTARSLFERRKRRTRFAIAQKNTGKPRLSVFRSNKHIHAQIIDDLGGRTLVAASSTEKDLKGEFAHGGNISAATKVGQLLAERAKAQGVTTVVFDRGGYIYHGRVKALADAARDGGLEF